MTDIAKAAAFSLPHNRRTLSLLRKGLPAVSFLALGAAIFLINPRAFSYFGVTLMLSLAMPILFATMSQMLVIAVNDLDLSIGPFVSLVACVGARWLVEEPLLGLLALAALVLAYALVGALVEWRRVPAMVVTLGMSFVWLGLAIILMPAPGGQAPGWLHQLMVWRPFLVPLPLLVAFAAGAGMHFLLMRSSFGILLRGSGGNRRALLNAGWSALAIRCTLYGMAGLMGVLSGLSLLGLTTSADASMALRYTLLSIAGVILGGGEFHGGIVSPVGAVFGALTLTLASALLSFLQISPDWQIGAQGMILIVILALRVLLDRRPKSARGLS